MTGPVLQVEALDAWYGRAHILFGVSLEVGRGEVVALMGRNGAGKSTTIKAVMGLLERRRGRIRLRGQEIGRLPPHRIARLGVGFVPEDRRIFTDLTVKENLEVGRQPPRADAPTWTVEKVLDLFPPLRERRDAPAAVLSGGEQQMLTVSRTLMGNPLVLLLDEPSEGVAPVLVEQMADLIVDLKARGMSVLLSEQNVHFAELVSDRVYVLEKGHIRYAGTTSALAQDVETRRSYLTV